MACLMTTTRPSPPLSILCVFFLSVCPLSSPLSLSILLLLFRFTVHWGRPNLGLAWYLFLEMFAEHRLLYLAVFALTPLLHLPALSIKFARHAPSVLLVSTLILLAIFKPYPNMADYGIWTTSFVTLLPQPILTRLDLPFIRNLFTLVTIFVTIFGKRLWERWMWQASSNANFYFNCGLVWNVMQLFILTRVVWAGIKWKVEQEHHSLIRDGKEEKVLNKRQLYLKQE